MVGAGDWVQEIPNLHSILVGDQEFSISNPGVPMESLGKKAEGFTWQPEVEGGTGGLGPEPPPL